MLLPFAASRFLLKEFPHILQVLFYFRLQSAIVFIGRCKKIVVVWGNSGLRLKKF